MAKESLSRLKSYISKGDIETALDQGLQMFKGEEENILFNLSFRYFDVRSEKIKGIISDENFKLTQNQIVTSFLQVIGDVEKKYENNKSQSVFDLEPKESLIKFRTQIKGTEKNPFKEFIEDYRLVFNLKKEKNIGLDFYIDSENIISILAGVKQFVTGRRFEEAKFFDEKETINSLIYEGWLGAVKLLSPHVQEFQYNLNKNNLFSHTYSIHNYEKDFIYFLENVVGIKFAKYLSPSEKINQLLDDSIKLYKANYILSELNWKERWVALREREILNYEIDDTAFDETEGDEYFIAIHNAFNEIRPGSGRFNNYNDSMVAFMLLKRLNEFKSKKANKLPVFFDNNGIFEIALSKAKLEKEFLFELGDSHYSIIRHSKFFLLESLFSRQKEIEELIPEKVNDQFKSFRFFMEELNHEIDEEKIDWDYSFRNSVIQKFINSKFLSLFWLYHDKEPHQFVNKIFDLSTIKDDEAFKKELDGKIDSLKKELRNKIMSYSLKTQIYNDLLERTPRKYSTLKEGLEKCYKSENRFVLRCLNADYLCIDQKAINIIDEIIHDDFIILGISGSFDHFARRVALLVENGIRQDNHENVVVGLTLLFCFGDPKIICNIFEEEGYVHKKAFTAILHSHSILRSHGNLENIKNIIKKIKKEKFYIAQNDIDQFMIGFSLAHLYFRIWQAYNHESFISTFEIPKKNEKFYKTNIYLQNAIDIIEENLKSLNNNLINDLNRRIYIDLIDLYIFLHSAGMPNDELSKLHDKIQVLRNFEGDRYLWQPKNNITLSLYYSRCAFIDNLRKNEYLDLALKNVKHAVTQSVNVVEKALCENIQLKIEHVKHLS